MDVYLAAVKAGTQSGPRDQRRRGWRGPACRLL